MDEAMHGKVVLVTGTSSGIGRATAALLAKRGAMLIGVSRDPSAAADLAALMREAGRVEADALHVAADVTLEADVERCVAAGLARFGRIDAALNNASTGKGVLSALADFTMEDFDDAVSDGLRSVWLCMRAEIRAMKNAGGVIVNVASVNGLGAAPMGGLYSAAKAGVIALSKSGALDYAAAGIRVNALVAGAVDTRMLNGVLERVASGVGATKEDVAASYRARIPLGRLGTAHELAEAACWLLSSASAYVTGASIVVDGGMTAFAR